MAEVIHGEDVIIEMLVGGTYFPILCSTDIKVRQQQEVIYKTGPNSGLYKEKITRLTECYATVSGLSKIDNGAQLSIFYMMQESIRTVPQTIRIKFYDNLGGNKELSGSALIVSNELNASVNDFLNTTIELEFTGSITMQAVTPPVGSSSDVQIYGDWWQVQAGGNYIDDNIQASQNNSYTLFGKTLLLVERSGMQYDIITSGTPGNRQCYYNSSLKTLVFDTVFNVGETVWIIFK